MSAGRCAGCGNIGSSAQMNRHVLTCAAFLGLFRKRPEQCLDPEAEYERFKVEEDSSEARAQRRDARLERQFADQTVRRDWETDRWAPRDILEE